MEKQSVIPGKYIVILFSVLILFGLYLTSLYSYLLFHSFAEIFSIVIAFGIFMVAINSRRYLDNNYLLFIGIAYLFIGGLDMIHTLAYKGMGIFQGYDANLPTQLWIVTRYVESLSLLIAPLLVGRKLRINVVFIGYTAVVSSLLVAIFYWNIFPDCFVEGVGLTPFKKISEYIISLILLTSIFLLFQKRGEFDTGVLRLLLASIIVTIGAELSFTFYISVYGFSNLIGHFLKIVSFYLIYKAIIVTGLVEPYNLLFRDLKQSERTLRNSESRIRAIVGTAVDGIITINERCLVQSFNPAAAKIFGYVPDEVIGRNVKMLMPEAYHSKHDGYVANYLRTGKKKTIGIGREFVGQRKDGTTFPMDYAVSEVQLADRRLFTGIVRDITERKRAEEALRESEEKYRTLSSNIPGMIYRGRPDWSTEIITNSEMMCGYSVDEFNTQKVNWLNLIHPDDKQQVFEEGSKLPEKPMSIAQEYRILAKDGSMRWVSDHKTSFFKEDGSFIGVDGIVYDVTGHKLAEEKLRKSEAKNRSILNAIPDLIFVYHKDGTFLDFVPAEHVDLFVLPSEFLGRKVYEVLPAEVAQTTMNNLEQTLQTGDIQIFEYQLPIQNKIRDFEARLVAIGEDKVLAISRDVTERKEMDLMKDQFVSTVSHELRTPLTSIHGSLGLILGGAAGELPPQTKGLLDIAYNNSERLTRLINDILDIEKIESGKMEFNFQPLELMSLVEQAIEANHAYAEQFEIEFVLKGTLPDAKVNADSDRLMQLFANLLSNAAKFSPPNDMVEISVSRHDKAIRVAITDHGPGIPEKFRSRVFEKFAQADSSDARQKRGTGLGLSIAKAIVEKHGGKICFDTEINVGTTFYFDLPECHEQDVAAIADANPQHQPRILICEDDRDVANLLRMMLNQADFNTDIAYDAAQAKQLLAQIQYVAMTLDLILPGQACAEGRGDGISLIRELRKREHTRDLPIIVVSVKADDRRNELNGGAFGIIDWLDKPIDEARLIAAVQQAVLQSVRSHPGNRGSGSKPRILHVEDAPDLLQVVSAILKDDADVSSATNLHDAKQMLNQETYDLVILDLALPDGSGLDLLPLLNRQITSIPVVIFSAYEVDIEVARNVAATLVKSRTSNQELLDTIKLLIRHSD